MALDDLEEERRAVLDRAREDLEEVALLVAVGLDAELLERLDRHADVADAVGQRRVVLVRQAEELDAVLAQPWRTVPTMSSVRSAMCWQPGDRYQSRYSWIWLFFLPVAGSLIGNLIRPLPLVMTFDISAL